MASDLGPTRIPFWRWRTGLWCFGLACVPGCGRRALVSGDELENGPNLVVDAVSPGEGLAGLEGDPCSLVFAVASLDLLMDILLYVSF